MPNKAKPTNKQNPQTSQLSATFSVPSTGAIWLASYLSKAQRATLPVYSFYVALFTTTEKWEAAHQEVTNTYSFYILKEVLMKTCDSHQPQSIGAVGEYRETKSMPKILSAFP